MVREGGRVVEDVRRTVILRVRISEDEEVALKQLCELERTSKAEGLRLAIREAARFRGLWPPVVNKPD